MCIRDSTKLIAEAWDAGGLYQVGNFPAFRRWSEWNGRYRDDVREFLKGGLWAASAAAQRIIGSPDIYDTNIRGKDAYVNFLTCHDGFTLYDLCLLYTSPSQPRSGNCPRIYVL